MTELEAFKWWVAMNAHFTTKSFDIFKTRNKVKGSLESLIKRNDYKIFCYIAEKFSVREWIVYLASNCMYGYSDMIYNLNGGIENYNLHIARKQALTETIESDIMKLRESNITNGYDIIRALTANSITFETVVAINNVCPEIFDSVKKSGAMVILEPLFLRIEKSVKFVALKDIHKELILNYFGKKEKK